MSWRYCIPILISTIFVCLTELGYYYTIFIVLWIANILNLIWGEFTAKEIKETLYRFYMLPTGRMIKRLSATILISISIWAGYFITTYYPFSLKDVLFFALTFGVLVGCFHITLAHDLLHSQRKTDKALSSFLLLSANIPHLAIDHVFGHHRNIGLEEDATTAKLNQSFYHYFFKVSRSRLYEVFINQFSFPLFARKKIRKNGFILVSFQIIIWICLLLFVPQSTYLIIFFWIQGFTAYLLYELTNYIQHYGLNRKSIEDPIGQELAWNCYYKYTNYLLFMLPLHSLHHLPKSEKKKATEQLKSGPRMPHLYFVMIFLALIPPLWYKKMNPLVSHYNQKHANEIP